MRTWHDDVAEDMAQDYWLLRVMGKTHKQAWQSITGALQRRTRPAPYMVQRMGMGMDKIAVGKIRKRFK